MVSAQRKFRARISAYVRQLGKGDQRQKENCVSSPSGSVHITSPWLYGVTQRENKALLIYTEKVFPCAKRYVGNVMGNTNLSTLPTFVLLVY